MTLLLTENLTVTKNIFHFLVKYSDKTCAHAVCLTNFNVRFMSVNTVKHHPRKMIKRPLNRGSPEIGIRHLCPGLNTATIFTIFRSATNFTKIAIFRNFHNFRNFVKFTVLVEFFQLQIWPIFT